MLSRRRWVGVGITSALLIVVGASMGLGSLQPGRTSNMTAVARSAVTSAEQHPEDLATATFGQEYVFPSRVGVAVAAPTGLVPSGGGRSTPILVVRTTVLNHAATPCDVNAILGPSASYDGREVERLTDSRYGGAAGGGGVVPPGHHSVYETTFPAASGHLTLQYRAGFQFEAVQFGDPVQRPGGVGGGHP